MDINAVALVGAGLIGSGWATHLLCKGIVDITIYDVDAAVLEKSRKLLDSNLRFLCDSEVVTDEQRKKYLAIPRYTTNLKEAVGNADIIIENGPENLEIKQRILADIEAGARPDAIITSSTSGIMVNRIAEFSKHPERVIGAHPYHPVYLLPLLELVKNDRLDEKYLAAAKDFFTRLDKKPVLLHKDSPGYLGSRLMLALFREAVNVVMEGVCSIEDLDTAFTYGPGLRYALMGPYLTYQMTGGDSGISTMLQGPIGKGIESWMPSLADWDSWPDPVKRFFTEKLQTEIDAFMKRRTPGQGTTNAELVSFRDAGLVQILKYHGLL